MSRIHFENKSRMEPIDSKVTQCQQQGQYAHNVKSRTLEVRREGLPKIEEDGNPFVTLESKGSIRDLISK